MSKTVSFVTRDELAEWLESRADAEMKSISAVCQDIVAAEYHRQNGENTAKPGQEPSDPLDEPPFTTNPYAWYEPNTADSDEIAAVRVPDSAGLASDVRYYKTYDGAAEAIRRWYE